MFGTIQNNEIQQTTSYKVVVPFYAYAAVSLLIACVLLCLHTNIFTRHHFHPHTLAVTHLMALGWGTMMILGAGHQLLPVLLEGKLSSEGLAMMSFAFTALGIPFLVAGFYHFHTGWPMQAGALLVNAGVVCFLINVASSIWEKGKLEVHAVFMAVATLWLFSTTFLGLLLVFNFTRPLLPSDSVAYLSLHAHMGIVGWFLLLVMGVATRLIPMFLISKWSDNRSLWWIFSCVNLGLLGFIALSVADAEARFHYLPLAFLTTGLLIFGRFCYKAWRARIRKAVDDQVKVSLLSVAMMAVPLISVLATVPFLAQEKTNMVMLYGFTIFFGWLTAIILGMTFKTLPFIIWNKVYHLATGKTPVPKDLFNEPLFRWMAVVYLLGYLLMIAGILLQQEWLLKSGAIGLLAAAVLYVCNVGITLSHKKRA